MLGYWEKLHRYIPTGSIFGGLCIGALAGMTIAWEHTVPMSRLQLSTDTLRVLTVLIEII